ncbi:unnamed protein product [Jaminaea pallidilutea]
MTELARGTRSKSPSQDDDPPTPESHDSLFSLSDDEPGTDSIGDREDQLPQERCGIAAVQEAPPIPGLYFFPAILPASLEAELLCDISQQGLLAPEHGRDQAMLFGRYKEDPEGTDEMGKTGLPLWADGLVRTLAKLLQGHLEPRVWSLLFPDQPLASISRRSSKRLKTMRESPAMITQPCRSRQLIINHYTPGQGITPHIDLPTRFGDGIILCSLQSGIAMDFTRDEGEGRESKKRKVDAEPVSDRYSLWLPPRSALILSGEARWRWKHGISARHGDYVAVESSQSTAKEDAAWNSSQEYKRRQERTSVTIRWLKPGADVVGQG